MGGEQGLRACRHFFCANCIEQALSDHCPMCRAPFAKGAPLPKPAVDPKSFFRLACVPRDRQGGGGGKGSAIEDLRLTKMDAFQTICAVLPVNVSSFEQR